jgi:CheY-like chemotaxis protein
MARTNPPLAPSEDASQARSRRGRVLIVEDNPDAAEMLRELLVFHGHLAVVAGDGRDALKLASTFAPELVFCDVGLPDIDGYALAPALRAALAPKWMRLVAVTGYAGAEERARAHAAGFDEHLIKPVDLVTLEEVVERCIAARPQ